MTIAPEITSVAEHRDHLAEHLRRVNETGQPLVIAADAAGGTPEAVLLSPSAYDKLLDEAELAASLAALDRGMEDIKAGRTRPAKQAIEEIAARHGVKLDKRPASPDDEGGLP